MASHSDLRLTGHFVISMWGVPFAIFQSTLFKTYLIPKYILETTYIKGKRKFHKMIYYNRYVTVKAQTILQYNKLNTLMKFSFAYLSIVSNTCVKKNVCT